MIPIIFESFATLLARRNPRNYPACVSILRYLAILNYFFPAPFASQSRPKQPIPVRRPHFTFKSNKSFHLIHRITKMSDSCQSASLRRSQSPPQTPCSSPSTVTACTANIANDSSIILNTCAAFDTPPASLSVSASTSASATLAKTTPAVEASEVGTQSPALVAAQPEVYDEIVHSILELSPDEWFTEGQAAVFKEQSRSQEGAEILQGKFVAAFETASEAQMVYADILRESSLDPNTYAFRIFKTFTLASILHKQVCNP